MTAHDYHQKARYCRNMGAVAATKELRTYWLDMANLWISMGLNRKQWDPGFRER